MATCTDSRSTFKAHVEGSSSLSPFHCKQSLQWTAAIGTGQVFALLAWHTVLSSKPAGFGNHRDYDLRDDFYERQGVSGFSPRTDSQDAWIFRSPLPSSVVDATDFEMGRPR